MFLNLLTQQSYDKAIMQHVYCQAYRLPLLVYGACFCALLECKAWYCSMSPSMFAKYALKIKAKPRREVMSNEEACNSKKREVQTMSDTGTGAGSRSS
jgi:hypothetical protein